MTPETTLTAPSLPSLSERTSQVEAREHFALWKGAKHRLLIVLLMLLSFILPLSVGALTVHLHERHEDQLSIVASRKLALALSSHLDLTVQTIETFLDGFSDLADETSPEAIYARLGAARLPASIIQVSYIAPDGAVVATNLTPPGSGINLADREHIRVHMDDVSGNEIYISKPVKGRISGAWSVQFTRAVRGPDGKLRGILGASYQISDFIDFYEKFLPEGRGLIALIGRDGVVRASVPSTGQLDGQLADIILPGFEEIRLNGSGVYSGVAWDEVQRLGYLVHSDRYPFLVLVAADSGALVEESSEYHGTIWLTAVGGWLALAALTLLGLRYSKLERAYHEKELQANAQERESLVLQAISRVPGISVLHIENGQPIRIGEPTDDVLAGLIAERAASPEFLSRVASAAPTVTHEHFYHDGEAFEVEMVLTQLRPTAESSTSAPRGTSPATVVFAVDETAKRMEEYKLHQMSKMASLGEMVTGLAHEINQPLGVIRLAAHNAMAGLRKGLPSEHTAEKLERITRQVERMKGIIDHMRIFGRKDAPKIDPSLARAAVEGAMQILGAEIRIDRIELSFTDAVGDAKVPCRQEQLEQVLINLVLNARDAIRERIHSEPEFHGLIAIATERREIDGIAHVVVTVQDNGGGIPKEALDKVFQPFFTTKPSGQGTGLGLSISFGIIREYGGMLASANVGDGAVFSISLPEVTEDGTSAPSRPGNPGKLEASANR